MTILYGLFAIALLLLWTYRPPQDEGTYILAVVATWAYVFGAFCHAVRVFTERRREW